MLGFVKKIAISFGNHFLSGHSASEFTDTNETGHKKLPLTTYDYLPFMSSFYE